jgi:IgA Peptidase M64/Ig-like domain CHU_C associated/Secretion system C-terminal sorting domain
MLFCFHNLFSQTMKLDTIQYVGDSEHTYDLVILGEGYVESEIPKFKEDAKKVKDIFQRNDIFSKLLPKMNIFSIGTISQQSGISLRTSSPLPTDPIQIQNIKNTFFGIYFLNSFRAYHLEDSSTYKARNLASEFLPFSDNVLILTNDEDHSSGRATFQGVALATRFKSTDSLWSNYLVNHELAHSIGNLADEYYEGKEISFNKDITNDSTKIRWKDLLHLPDVGIDSIATGVYIPNRNCMMAFGAGRYTCPVCSKRLKEVVEEPKKLGNPHRIVLEKYDKDKKTIKYRWDLVPGATGYEVIFWASWRDGLIVKNTNTDNVTFELSEADNMALPSWRVTIQIRAFNSTSSSQFEYYRTSIYAHTTLSIPVVKETKQISETSYKLFIESKDKTVKVNWLRLYNEEGIHSDILTYKDSITLHNLKKGKKYFYQIAAAIPEESSDFFASPFSPKLPLIDLCATGPKQLSSERFEYCLNANTQPLPIKADEGNTLLWYLTDTSTTASLTPPVISSTKSGSTYYYVSQTNSQGCEGLKATIEIKINNLPAVPIVENVEYCQNATPLPLNATANPGNQILWYTSVTSNTGSTQTPSVSTANPGTTQYFVSQKSQQGCESLKATIEVEINTPPVVPIVENKDYCQNATPLPLNATANPGNQIWWYSSDTSNTGSTQAPSVTTANPGATQHFVSQKSQQGCESQRVALNIQVVPNPITPVAENLDICQFAALVPLKVNFDSNNELRWYQTINSTSSSNVTPSYSTKVYGIPITYYVSQRSKLGCESPKATLIINVKYTPEAPFVYHQKELCQNDEDVRPLRVDHNPTSKILWYTDTTKVGSSQIPVISSNQAGKYRFFVTETANTGCESAKTEININIKPAPPAPTLSIVNNMEIQSSAKTNFWYWNNIGIADTTQVIKPKFSGNYTAEAVVDRCKSKKSEALNFMITSLEEELLSKFTIKPNPSEDYIILDFSINESRLDKVDLVAFTGEIVSTYADLDSGSKLYVGDLPKGVYFLKIYIKSKDMVVTKKLVKI